MLRTRTPLQRTAPRATSYVALRGEMRVRRSRGGGGSPAPENSSRFDATSSALSRYPRCLRGRRGSRRIEVIDGRRLRSFAELPVRSGTFGVGSGTFGASQIRLVAGSVPISSTWRPLVLRRNSRDGPHGKVPEHAPKVPDHAPKGPEGAVHVQTGAQARGWRDPIFGSFDVTSARARLYRALHIAFAAPSCVGTSRRFAFPCTSERCGAGSYDPPLARWCGSEPTRRRSWGAPRRRGRRPRAPGALGRARPYAADNHEPPPPRGDRS